jgi:hypothetical protein
MTTTTTTTYAIKFTKAVRAKMMGMSKSEVMSYLRELGCDMTKVYYEETKHQIPYRICPRQGWNSPHLYFNKDTRRVDRMW